MKATGLVRGDVLSGRYEIQRLIGKGGTSRVFLAADLTLNNKLWAVKEADRRAVDAAGRSVEQVLAREAFVLSKVDHPGIVRIVDTVATEDFVYVVMDYVEGEPLDRIVRRDGAQSEDDVRRWMLELCGVLEYLHAQEPPIVYRDMKPANIMLHPDGYVKLVDFGIVREYCDDNPACQDTVALGTQGYAPPEQYGKEQTDCRADIYALGATMWHLLAGEAPPAGFPLPDVRTVNPQVGEGFAEVVIPKCTQLAREERYQNCREVAEDLSACETLTRDYRARQARVVRSFALSGAFALIMMVVGLGLLAVRESVVMQRYESLLALGADMLQTDPATASERYLAAVEKCPAEVDAYEGLIACYKADGVFTTAEKSQFDSVYQLNLDQLRPSKRFAELSYDIGRLYWTYYECGQPDDLGGESDNRSSRIKASAEYFKNAAADPLFEHHGRAVLYSEIAQFTSNIAHATREGDDDALYEPFWGNLVEIAQLLPGETNDRIKLDGCELVVSALETYLDKFKNVVGVDEGEVRLLVLAVESCTKVPIVTDEALELRRGRIETRLGNELERRLEVVYASSSSAVPTRQAA